MKKNTPDNDKIKMAKDICTAIEKGESLDANDLGISKDKIEKIQSILNDRQTLEKIMKSETAKSIMKNFGEE